ncbi:hypothetical protein KBB60_00835 [Patescibacteria group bacterium]|nr:hypothetical protein [Patescibacteria group bacterium]
MSIAMPPKQQNTIVAHLVQKAPHSQHRTCAFSFFAIHMRPLNSKLSTSDNRIKLFLPVATKKINLFTGLK